MVLSAGRVAETTAIPMEAKTLAVLETFSFATALRQS